MNKRIMTIFEKVKCAMGFHEEENVGMGYGLLFIEGQQLETECRLYRCIRCGHESGQITCPELIMWAPRNVPAEMVRQTSRFQEFNSNH